MIATLISITGALLLGLAALLSPAAGVADPVGNIPRGVFANPELQVMYGEPVARGSQTAADALRVGIDIETDDIADLQVAPANVTHRDIAWVYGNLPRGSERHLAAF